MQFADRRSCFRIVLPISATRRKGIASELRNLGFGDHERHAEEALGNLRVLRRPSSTPLLYHGAIRSDDYRHRCSKQPVSAPDLVGNESCRYCTQATVDEVLSESLDVLCGTSKNDRLEALTIDLIDELTPVGHLLISTVPVAPDRRLRRFRAIVSR